MTNKEPIAFFDPHFHLWDLNPSSGAGTESGHDASILFPPSGSNLYDLKAYQSDLENEHIKISGGVFLEANSVCHVDMRGEDVFAELCLRESTWASSQVKDAAQTYVLVGTASLESPNVEETLKQLKDIPGMRGIRQIVNSAPDWPRNKNLGNLLENEQFKKGFASLAKFDMSFDLQLNPHQYTQAAELISKHPHIPVIINHLGTPTLQELKEQNSMVMDGMRALATCPNTYLKISMLCYIAPNWDEDELVLSTVHSLIKIFGVHRCFFASNYPVDVKDGWPSSKLVPAFLKLSQNYSHEERVGLFSENAKRAYKV
eukprot:m.17222 g.17222  ORF g.17222 m.17222 type:complete len:316 (+) comp5949_c0_seq1:44-991(+)